MLSIFCARKIKKYEKDKAIIKLRKVAFKNTDRDIKKLLIKM